MLFQINCGIPLELGRLPVENGANLTTGGEQQKLSPPTPFADTKGTNCCFSEEQAGQEEAQEEIGGDAAGMVFQSNRIPEPLPMPNLTDHFSPAPTPINEPGETQGNESCQHLILLCFLCFRI